MRRRVVTRAIGHARHDNARPLSREQSARRWPAPDRPHIVVPPGATNTVQAAAATTETPTRNWRWQSRLARPRRRAVLGYIKVQWAHYSERRAEIYQAFAPLLDALEGAHQRPGDEATVETLLPSTQITS
jgi:hypothetical protein